MQAGADPTFRRKSCEAGAFGQKPSERAIGEIAIFRCEPDRRPRNSNIPRRPGKAGEAAMFRGAPELGTDPRQQCHGAATREGNDLGRKVLAEFRSAKGRKPGPHRLWYRPKESGGWQQCQPPLLCADHEARAGRAMSLRKDGVVLNPLDPYLSFPHSGLSRSEHGRLHAAAPLCRGQRQPMPAGAGHGR